MMRLHPVAFWLIVVLSALGIWGWFSSRLILNAPRAIDFIAPENIKIPSENVVFYSGKRKLVGWFIPSEINSDSTIILAHGWGASKGDILPSTVFLRAHHNLLYFDFTNHGESGGSKTSMGKFESEDIIAAVDFLVKNKPLSSKKIAVYGLSMGASAAIVAAGKDIRIRSVAAESPFYSFNEIVSHYARRFLNLPHYPFVPLALVATRLRLGFDPEKYSPRFYFDKIHPRQVMIMASMGDQNIPFSISEKLYNHKIPLESKRLVVFGKDVAHAEASSAETEKYKNVLKEFFYDTLQK